MLLETHEFCLRCANQCIRIEETPFVAQIIAYCSPLGLKSIQILCLTGEIMEQLLSCFGCAQVKSKASMKFWFNFDHLRFLCFVHRLHQKGQKNQHLWKININSSRIPTCFTCRIQLHLSPNQMRQFSCFRYTNLPSPSFRSPVCY